MADGTSAEELPRTAIVTSIPTGYARYLFHFAPRKKGRSSMQAGLGSAPIGVIGLGLLGSALCERLLGSEYSVRVYNRTREKALPLIERGAAWSDNPFLDCERVILCLFSTDVVEEVLESFDDSLRPGHIVMDVTTGVPQRMHLIGQRLAARQVQYLEAPISGSSQQTREHLATAIVAGPVDAFELCRDILDAIAAKTYYVGPWGNAIRMKLVTNLVLGLNRAALAEGLAFARSIGLSLDDSLTVLTNSAAYSRTMETKGRKMITGDFTPEAKLVQHLKDVRIILEEAGRNGRALPFTVLHQEVLATAVAEKLGELDNSAIFQVLDAP